MTQTNEREQCTAIINGYVVPVSSPPIEGGTVVLRGGRIAAVGADVEVPPDAVIVDAAGRWVLPGFFDAHTHLGIDEESIGTPGDDTNESSGPNMADVRALDGVNIEDEGFRDALSAGITSVSIKPGSGNPIGGQTIIIKTWGGRTIDEQLVSDSVSMKSAFGENPKVVFGAHNAKPMTRLGIAAVIRQALEDAKDYGTRREAAVKAGQPFDVNLISEALVRLLAGELRWDVHVHRHDDIATAMRVAEEYGLRLVVNHGTDAHLLAGPLAERGIPVMVGPIITSRSKQELAGHTVTTAAILARAGVKVSIITDHPQVPVNYLPLQAAIAVRAGLPYETALEAITVNPASVLGVDDRVGALRPGLDADVVIWSGDPLLVQSRAEQVWIEGVSVYTWVDGKGQTMPRFT